MKVNAGLGTVAVHGGHYQSGLGVIALDHGTFHDDRFAAGRVREPVDMVRDQIGEHREQDQSHTGGDDQRAQSELSHDGKDVWSLFSMTDTCNIMKTTFEYPGAHLARHEQAYSS